MRGHHASSLKPADLLLMILFVGTNTLTLLPRTDY